MLWGGEVAWQSGSACGSGCCRVTTGLHCLVYVHGSRLHRAVRLAACRPCTSLHSAVGASFQTCQLRWQVVWQVMHCFVHCMPRDLACMQFADGGAAARGGGRQQIRQAEPSTHALHRQCTPQAPVCCASRLAWPHKSPNLEPLVCMLWIALPCLVTNPSASLGDAFIRCDCVSLRPLSRSVWLLGRDRVPADATARNQEGGCE